MSAYLEKKMKLFIQGNDIMKIFGKGLGGLQLMDLSSFVNNPFSIINHCNLCNYKVQEVYKYFNYIKQNNQNSSCSFYKKSRLVNSKEKIE